MTQLPWDLSKLFLWLLFRLRFDLRVTGQEHVPRTGPCILAINHTSHLDPPVVGVACPRRMIFMAKTELFKGLLGAYLRAIRVMPLQRGESDFGALRQAIHLLREGAVLGLFPEGTRQLSGALGEAKRGVGVLAIAAEVPIVPVLVQGTFDVLPPEAKGLQRGKIRVAFGPAISYTSVFETSTRAFTRKEAAADLSRQVTQRWRALASRIAGGDQPPR